MVVETSTSDKITTSGNPWVFRTGPTNGMMAQAFAKYIDDLKIEKAAFLVVNNDWGLGVAQEFSEMLKEQDVEPGRIETMDAAAQDLSAQLAKVKASDTDTLFVTTEVSQLTLVMRQAQSLQLPQQIIAATGSSSPDQIIDQAGAAADGVYFVVFFTPWFTEAMPNPDIAKRFVEEWKERGYNVAGLTEGFRGYDGITTIAAAIEKAGKAEPVAIRDALWDVRVKGLNSDIEFVKEGPEDMGSGQNQANVYVVQVEDGKVVKPDF
jgi:branched-chain amino acid transport system substrate-binding protein